MRYVSMRFPGGKAKAVTLSYDDGCPQDIPFAALLDKYGIKATFNHNSRSLREGLSLPTLSKAEVEEHILARGHEIAVHGHQHRANGSLRPIEGIRDVLDCRLELEQEYGIIIRGMAYPNAGITEFSPGVTYDQVRQYLAQLDIAYARTLRGDNDRFQLPDDWYNWVPTAHHNNPSLMEYIDKFTALNAVEEPYSATHGPWLFFLWGHTYEFDQDDNWALAETFCARLGGREDTWYATNMEVYEYTKAYEALQYSADGHIIHNPTIHTLWLDVDWQTYVIRPGETLHIEA